MRTTFFWLFILTIVAWISYEIVALRNPVPGDTISEIVWGLSRRPFVPFTVGFVLGLLMGHFFWQSVEP